MDAGKLKKTTKSIQQKLLKYFMRQSWKLKGDLEIFKKMLQ